MNLQVLLGTVILFTRNLVTQLVVFTGETLALLLQGLDVAILGLKLLLQTSDLTSIASLRKTGRVLSASLLITLEKSDSVLKTEDVQDHGVSTVEDKRQEESEPAKIHVALRVELPGLDFHAISTEGGGSVYASKLVPVLDIGKKAFIVG